MPEIQTGRFLGGARVRIHCARLILLAMAVCGEGSHAQGSVAGDRAALMALAYATGAGHWSSNANWGSDEPLSEWHGVTTDESGRVMALHLSGNGLGGAIPAELGNLTNLQQLYLHDNYLSGTIPAELGNLTKLASLNLGQNALSGTIPAELGGLTNLQQLYLHDNYLSGAIPAELGNLTSLQSLDLASNDLSGAIPSGLGSLPRLQHLKLRDNSELEGVIPDSLRQLSRLQNLDVVGAELCAPGDTVFQAWLAGITFSGLVCPPESASTIDVAVFYTPAVVSIYGGAAQTEAGIDLLLAETNRALVDSAVDAELRLAVAQEIDYRESNRHIDMERLTSRSDGHMDEIHDVIDRVGADITILLSPDSGCYGLAARTLVGDPDDVDLAFALVGAECPVTFVHEVGHLLGLSHDRYEACRGDGSCRGYRYGYVNQRAFSRSADPSSRWSTIMAYADQCRNAGFYCNRLLRFSNPDQTHLADPLGVPGLQRTEAVDGPANAVRFMNRSRETVARFRSRADEIEVSINPPGVVVDEGQSATLTVQLNRAPGRSVAIPLVTAHEGGAQDADYSGVPESVTFASRETEATIEFQAVDDREDDDGERVVLGLGSDLPQGVSAGSPATASVTIQDNDPVLVAPVVTTLGPFSAVEGETAVGTLAASDADTPADNLQWSITGGADSTHFALSAGGALAFLASKDYEAPDDAGGDGTYNLTVQVSDGTSSTKAEVRVALENRNEAPTADAGPDQGEIAEGTTVTLSGSGEDPDAGDTLSYRWAQTGGPAVTLSAPSAAATTFVAPSGLEEDAVLRFQLRVTDGGGLSAEDELAVTVKRPALLTGSFASLPATHRGQGTLVLRIQFSEPVATRFRTMRDQSLAVTNGQVRSARRVGGRRDLWEIVIAPSSIADVEVVLPVTLDCAAAGAVCTAEGKPLATRLAATIRGPDESELAVISIAAVADTVTEGEPALFEVSRTGPATEELTVQLSRTITTGTRSSTRSATTRFPRGRKSVRVSWSVSGPTRIVSDDRIITWTVEEGSGYRVSADASTAQVVMKEDDVAELALTVDPAEIGEGESATVQVAITNDVTFADEQAIALGFEGSTAAKGADYTVAPETLTLRGGATSVRTTVTALVDGDEEGDETIAITASRAGETIGTTAVVITGTEDGKDGESEPSGEGFSLAPENSRPSGIWSDGETAWVADLDDARLYAYQRPDGERDSTKDVATGPAPMGLWSDGETLWVAHLGGGLRAHRLADGTRQAWLDLALEANSEPAGVWSDGETAWVSEWLGDTVHAYRLEDGRREAGRDIKLASGNLLPVGLWSDGGTLWVADWRERVYAYRLSDGRREPGKDIHAGVGDTDPSGLWSGGGPLLSTSWEAAEVRAYRLPELPAPGVARGKDGTGGPPARAASLPPIADPALRAAIGAALGKAPGEEVSPEELAGLDALVARNGGIRDLAGLERAVGLEQLDLGFNALSDLRPLAALPRLESLNLDGAAPDLQVLASLTGLRRLSVRNNGIEDLGALASLTGLTELDVGDNRIEDLSPLAGLAALTVLRADRNRIADVWPLVSLVELDALELGSNRVHDLQALAGMSQLRTLRLGSNRLVELYPLSGLEGLSELDLADNAVENLRALADLDGLRRLDLRGTAVGDLRPLRALPSLVWVHVGGSRIEDLAPLDGLPGLTVAGRDDRQPPEAVGGGAGHASRD